MSASSAKKPMPEVKEEKKRRVRALSQADVRCNVANCNYAAKTNKTVENHRLKVHGVAPEKSFMDQSVSFLASEDSGALSDGSLDHKTSAEFYHDMSKARQSTQLTEAEKEVRKRNRSEEDEEADKKPKLEHSSRGAGQQSQKTLERQVLIKEALESATKRNKEVLDTSASLLENTSVAREFDELFTESQAVDETGTLNETTMLTAREGSSYTELEETKVDQVTDKESLGLDDTHGDVLQEEMKSLANDLKLRTESLQDALAEVEHYKSKVAASTREKEYLEAKLTSKEQELTCLTEAVRVMKASLDQPTDSAKDRKKVESLSRKVASQEKTISQLKDENERLRTSAESSQTIATALKTTQADLLSQVTRLKKLTNCLDENCDSDKKCGQSHARKEENRGPCKYFLYDKCNKSNECTYKHDLAAKKKYHEERQKKKDEEKAKKEKEEEEAKEKAKKEEEEKEEKKKKDAEEAKEKKKNKMKEKVKQKRKRRREAGKGGAKDDSRSMDVDNPVSNSSSSKVEPAAKKLKEQQDQKPETAKQEAIPSPSVPIPSQAPPPSHISAPPPNFQATNNFQQPPPPTLQTQPPNPRNIHFQPTIPNHFNFAPSPMIIPQLPAGSQAQNWQQQPNMNIDFLRQEAIQAQTLNRSVRLNNLRNEIANVQARITNTRISHPPGTVDMSSLLAAEQELKQKLYEATYLN